MPENDFRPSRSRRSAMSFAGQRDAGLRANHGRRIPARLVASRFLAGFDGRKMWHTERGGSGWPNSRHWPLYRQGRLAQTAVSRRGLPAAEGGGRRTRARRNAEDHDSRSGHDAAARRPQGGRPALTTDMDLFWSDLAAAYRREIAALADAGHHLQMPDDRRELRLSVRRSRARLRERGEEQKGAAALSRRPPTRPCATGPRA